MNKQTLWISYSKGMRRLGSFHADFEIESLQESTRSAGLPGLEQKDASTVAK